MRRLPPAARLRMRGTVWPSQPLAPSNEIAKHGASGKLGIARLPVELQSSIMRELRGVDRKAVRREAEALWHNFHAECLPDSTSKYAPDGSYLTKRERARQRSARAFPVQPRLDELGVLAWAVSLMPHVYACVLAALRQVANRAPDVTIDHVYEEASMGTAAWAARTVWPTLSSYRGIEHSIASSALASRLTDALSKRGVDVQIGSGRQLSRQNVRPASIAISAFALQNFGSDERALRRHLRALLDKSDAEIVVIIDQGTPAGFNRVEQVRRFMLKEGDKSQLRLPSTTTTVRRGLDVIAPVRASFQQPHIRLIGSLVPTSKPMSSIRHQSLQISDPVCAALKTRRRSTAQHSSDARTEAQRNASSNKKGEMRAMFSYVALRRRCTATAAGDVTDQDDAHQTDTTKWLRVLREPIRSGKAAVTFAGCLPTGKVSQVTVTAEREGAQVYRDALKASWGDLWPHEPWGGLYGIDSIAEHDGERPRPGRSGSAETEAEDDDAVPPVDLTAVLR